MSWQYGLVRKIVDGYEYFEVSEIYDNGSYLADNISLSGESIEDVIINLEIMLNDIKNRTLVINEIKEIV